jgi:hypothetical protein
MQVPQTIEPDHPRAPTTRRKDKAALVPTRVQPPQGRIQARTPVPLGARQRVVMRHAINVLALREQASCDTRYTPCSLLQHAKMPINYEHYANLMVHPVTGRMISSYKKLMHDPAMAEVWQTAFGKDFGGMAQGCNEQGKRGPMPCL